VLLNTNKSQTICSGNQYLISVCNSLYACGKNFKFDPVTYCLIYYLNVMYVIIDILDKDRKASGQNVVCISNF